MFIDALMEHNPAIQKYGTIIQRNPSAPRKRLDFDSSPKPTIPKISFLVYFIVVDGVVCKIGQSASPESAFTWYVRLSQNMGKGRYIPYYWMYEQVNQGKEVSFWFECIEEVYVEYPHAITGAPIQHLAIFGKDREKEYLDFIYSEEGEYPLLNRQEKMSRADSFERYYTAMYKEEGGRVA